jgi:hypothetical protein
MEPGSSLVHHFDRCQIAMSIQFWGLTSWLALPNPRAELGQNLSGSTSALFLCAKFAPDQIEIAASHLAAGLCKWGPGNTWISCIPSSCHALRVCQDYWQLQSIFVPCLPILYSTSTKSELQFSPWSVCGVLFAVVLLLPLWRVFKGSILCPGKQCHTQL